MRADVRATLSRIRNAIATYHGTGVDDTPSTIAKRFGVSVQALMRANKWRSARRLVPGQPVRVPVPNKREPATRAAVESGRVRVAAHDKNRTRGPH